VYQQVLEMRGSAVEQLEAVLGCTVDEALTLLSGREVLPMKSQSAGESAAGPPHSQGARRRKPALRAGFWRSG
jgi:hypothetical protein